MKHHLGTIQQFGSHEIWLFERASCFTGVAFREVTLYITLGALKKYSNLVDPLLAQAPSGTRLIPKSVTLKKLIAPLKLVNKEAEPVASHQLPGVDGPTMPFIDRGLQSLPARI